MTTIPKLISTSTIVALPLLAVPASAQVPKEKPTDVTVEGHVFKPKESKPNAEFAKTLSVMEGAEISIFDEGLSNTRMLAIGDNAGKRI